MQEKRTFQSSGIIALMSILCVLFTSCTPWESELEEIYAAAQKGDRLSQFAVIEEHRIFKEIVPADTIQVYLWRFIKEGNHRAISLAKGIDGDKLDHNSKNYADAYDKMALKWDNIGVGYDNYLSYMYLGDRYMDKYRSSGRQQDSLRAEELYRKSIEAGNRNLMLERDAKAGLGAVIKGGIEYGKYSHKNIFNDRSFIARLVLSCSYSYAYITSGAVKLLFTAAWWKVLLILSGMILLLMIPIVLCNNLLPSGPEKEGASKVSVWGVLFGFWNSMCFYAAISNHNLVWLNNTNSLLFPPSAYGLQQYLAIIMNWVALIYIVIVLLKTIKDCRANMMSAGEIVKAVFVKAIIFIVAYLVAQIGGYLMVVVVLGLIALVLAGVTIVSAPSAVLSSDSSEDSVVEKTYPTHLGFCKNCIHQKADTGYCVKSATECGDYGACEFYQEKL